MTTVYVYVMDTMADWELAYVMAELNSKRFFKKDAPDVEVKTVGITKNAVCSMGGLTIVPDETLEDIEVKKENMIILPGSNQWNASEHDKILEVALRFRECGGCICAICGATVALANIGMLDEVKYASNGQGFLEMMSPGYKGQNFFIDEPAVRDGNIITASATGGLALARIIIEYLNVFQKNTLEHWYNYFNTGNAQEFFAMMQSLQ